MIGQKIRSCTKFAFVCLELNKVIKIISVGNSVPAWIEP